MGIFGQDILKSKDNLAGPLLTEDRKTGMRVIQIVQTPQRRGAEIFAYDLSLELENEGASTKIIYLYGYAGDEAIPLRAQDVCLNGKADNPLERSLGFQPWLLLRLKREIDRFKPDIVQLNGARSIKYGAMAKALSVRAPRWKLVYRTINIPSHWQRNSRILYLYKTFVMPRMDGVISVCSPGLADAKALYGLDVPSRVVLNGFDPSRLQGRVSSRADFRSLAGAREEDIVLLFLGSLVPQKRPDRFVRLMGRLLEHNRNYFGWIVGDGFLRDETERQAQEMGLQDRIRFFGYQREVGTFLTAADIYVLTSDTEGLPATVLEAGFLGVPVVSTDVGGVYEAVRDGENGILVPRDDELALKDRIEWLAQNDSVRIQMAERARRRFAAEFTIQRIAREYMDFYQGIHPR